MLEALRQPWPWYVAGPLIGLMVPLLLVLDGRLFGISSNLRHLCAAAAPALPARWMPRFLRYDWWRAGAWNLAFAAGIVLGGWAAATWLGGGEPVRIAADSLAIVASLGLGTAAGAGVELVPAELFGWEALASPAGWIILCGGGFLVGFGSRWAGGCTSGHGVSGLADLQLSSLLAVVGFFAGGLAASHWLLPWVLR